MLSASAPNPFPEPDTSYVCAADRWGNLFSATPSDGSYGSPIVPGTGFIPSNRGSQSRPDPRHPAGVAPGKRPRLTPNPALAIKGNGEQFMPFGTPGGDVQTQAMLQVLLNVFVHGQDVQGAIEAPRFASYSYPSSFAPYDYYPGRLNLEARFSDKIADELARTRPQDRALARLGLARRRGVRDPRRSRSAASSKPAPTRAAPPTRWGGDFSKNENTARGRAWPGHPRFMSRALSIKT